VSLVDIEKELKGAISSAFRRGQLSGIEAARVACDKFLTSLPSPSHDLKAFRAVLNILYTQLEMINDQGTA